MVGATHKQFLAAIKELAVLTGWLPYYTVDSRHSPAGFPDLILLRGNRMVVAELKVRHYPRKGSPQLDTLKPEQQEWLEAFSRITGGEVFLWDPEDWNELSDVLR